jgi:DNA ligase D-like protein (predicted 3'-phosphoesterase)
MSEARFVVQEHYARSHHFDFRLEKDGVFKSWAVPKGLPERTGLKRLAVQVEDHALDFGQFEGAIPAGEYGAGRVTIWDHGTYELAEWAADYIAFTLSGSRVAGRFALVRFKQGDPRNWLLIKRRET